MSTSLLYHTQSLHGFLFEKFDFSGGQTIATVERQPDKFVCPVCKSPSVTATRVYERLVQGLPMGRHRFCHWHVQGTLGRLPERSLNCGRR